MPKRGKCEAFHATEIEENTKGLLKGFINRENVSIITASKRSLQPSSRKEKHLEKQIVSLRVLEKEGASWSSCKFSRHDASSCNHNNNLPTGLLPRSMFPWKFRIFIWAMTNVRPNATN